MAVLGGTGTESTDSDLVEEKQKKCAHVFFHKSIEEACPEVMYCIFCGKVLTMEEAEELDILKGDLF